jgi:FkbM family methyltransferase
MNFVQRAARRFSGAIGRNTALINRLRPAYDRYLEWASGGRGILVPVNDETFRVEPRYRVHFPETYDAPVWRYLRAHVKPDQICLNIGAHMGIYALALGRWTAPSGIVFAFEPNPSTRTGLMRHVEMNGLADRVEVVPTAISDAPGEGAFYAIAEEAFSRLAGPNPRLSSTDEIRVRLSSVDAFCAERRIRPDWITIDIEGFEIAALRGARATIDAHRGRLGLIVEMHPAHWLASGGSREMMADVLRSLALTPVPLTGQSDPLGDYGIVRLGYA